MARAALALSLLLAISACDRGHEKTREIAYVSSERVAMRDRVAALYNKTGTLKNGDRVVVLERARRFVRVKNDAGETGWVQDSHLVGEDVYQEFKMVADYNRKEPVQAHAATRASLRIHILPGRDTPSLIELSEGAKLEILKRTTIEKPQRGALARPRNAAEKEDRPSPAEPPPVPMEDWLMVRDAQGHTGWVLARMVDVDLPLEVAQYSEGQRIVAFFVLNKVHDPDAPNPTDDDAARGPRDIAQYLVLYTEPKDGLPWDFNQARVFTWNVKRHRYETAYRERNMVGMFPVTVGTADFGKEGELPVFTLRVKDEDGSRREKKYRMIGPIVRRVMTPEEQAAEKAAQKAAREARRKKR